MEKLKQNQSEALLTGRPMPTLPAFALPIILGNVFQQLYNVVDAVVVGKFLGDLPLAGISVASPMMDILYALIIGGSVGVAQNLGHGSRGRVRRYYRCGVTAEVVLGRVICLVCVLFAPRLIGIFSDNDAVIAAGATYTGTMAFFYWASYLGEIIQSFFRGIGRLRLTMIASGSQVLLRVILSYFLVPLWGVYGICAAVATGWILLVAFEGSYSLRKVKAFSGESGK